MIPPTIITWILVLFGLITCAPLLFIQFRVIMDPHGRTVKDFVIGKDLDWRDETHLLSAIGGSRADWIVFAPLLVLGTIGVLIGSTWGYVLYAAAGAVMLYINVSLWYQEKKNVYPVVGPVAYYTYYWGDFVYWGAASVIYAMIRLNGIPV